MILLSSIKDHLVMLAPAIDLTVLTILPLDTIVVVINQVRSISDLSLREQILF
jgi:hypothetical protein